MKMEVEENSLEILYVVYFVFIFQNYLFSVMFVLWSCLKVVVIYLNVCMSLNYIIDREFRFL